MTCCPRARGISLPERKVNVNRHGSGSFAICLMPCLLPCPPHHFVFPHSLLRDILPRRKWRPRGLDPCWTSSLRMWNHSRNSYLWLQLCYHSNLCTGCLRFGWLHRNIRFLRGFLPRNAPRFLNLYRVGEDHN